MNFNKTVDRRNTNSVKWNKNAIESISANREALPFWVADMDFYPEPNIKKKAEEIASLGVFGYPTFENFNSIASEWLENKHSWKVPKENILYSMGLLHGIALAIDIFTNPGDKILVPSPTYRPFRELCSRSERIMVDHELGYDNGMFYLDKERFEEDTRNAKMILFCSPHNPSGLVFTEDELHFVLKTARKYDIPILSDEIHSDLVHTHAHHIPMGKANEGINARCITFMAPSKTFNVAGEHSAIAIFSNSDMESKFRKRQEALWVTEPGYLIGELTEVAYSKGLEYNQKLCQYLEDNALFIKEYLKKNCPEIVFVNGEASFVTFLDCSAIFDKVKATEEANPDRYKGGNGGGILSRFFGVEAGVAMNDGTWFGDQYSRFVRFNYGTSKDNVEKALARIAKAIKAL